MNLEACKTKDVMQLNMIDVLLCANADPDWLMVPNTDTTEEYRHLRDLISDAIVAGFMKDMTVVKGTYREWFALLPKGRLYLKRLRGDHD